MKMMICLVSTIYASLSGSNLNNKEKEPSKILSLQVVGRPINAPEVLDLR